MLQLSSEEKPPLEEAIPDPVGNAWHTVSVDQMLQSNVTFFEDLNRLVKKKCYIFRIRVARDLVFL